MSAHERLEREMAIAEGRAWLETRPAASMATNRVAGAFYYPGAHMDGAGYGDILMAIREPDNPHDNNAIAPSCVVNCRPKANQWSCGN